MADINEMVDQITEEVFKELLKRGWNVIAATRKPNAQSLEKLKAEWGDKIQTLYLDVSDEKSIEEFSKNLSGKSVDVLFNNAGVLFRDDSLSVKYDEFLYTMKVNVMGLLFVAKALFENLRLSDHPRILNTSSIMGSISMYSGTHSISYTVSKTALNMITKVMASQLSKYGIIVVSIHPGWVRTDMGGSAAPVMPEESARGIVNIAEKLTMKDNGKFLEYTGKELPW